VRVELTSNADEAAEVSALWTLHSRAGIALKQRTVLSCGISGAVASAYILYRSGTTGVFSVLVGIAVGALVGWAYALVYGPVVRARIRRYLRDTLGTGPYPFAAELRDSGLWFKLRDIESHWAWSALRDIRETGRGVEMWFDTGIVLVRPRAFTTPEEQRQFAQRARQLSHTSHQGD
jgi:hypothetical protein